MVIDLFHATNKKTTLGFLVLAGHTTKVTTVGMLLGSCLALPSGHGKNAVNFM
jgi:hypothetical protein